MFYVLYVSYLRIDFNIQLFLSKEIYKVVLKL